MATEQDKLITVVEIVDKYSKELNKMREEFGKTSKQLLEVGKTSSNGGDGLKKLVSSFINFKGVLLGAGIGIAINQIKNIGLHAIRAASDMSELENVTKQVFEKNSQEIAKWADEIDQTVGRSIYQLQKYASTFGSMFKGAGFEENTFKEWSKDLTKLTADFSSFFNVADEQAFTAIKGVLTGETEAMKQFGFVLNETTMAEYALTQGIKTKWSALSESEKMQLRYNALMEKTKHIHGDAERTIDGYANQLKVAQGHMSNIATELGKKLLPSAEGAMHMFNGLLKVVEDFAKKKELSDYTLPFLEEREQINSLYQEYEKLSKAPTRSTEDEEKRLQLLNELKNKYPDLLSNISSEASKYEEVKEAVEDVIDALNRKMKLQMQADLQSQIQEMVKNVTKEISDNSLAVTKAKVKITDDYKKFNARLEALNEEDMKNFNSEMIKVKNKYGQIVGVTNEMKSILSKYADISQMNEKELKGFAQSFSSYIGITISSLAKNNQIAEKAQKDMKKVADEYTSMMKIADDLAKYGLSTDSIQQIIETSAKENGAKIEQLEGVLLRKTSKIEGVIYDSEGKIIADTRDMGNAISVDDALNHLDTRGVIYSVVGGAMTSFRKLANGMIEMSQDKEIKNRGIDNSKMRLESFTGVESSKKIISKEDFSKLLNLDIKKINRQGARKGGTGSSGKRGTGSSRKGGEKNEKNKWEQQIESLTKTLKDLQIPIDKFKEKIKQLVIETNKFEIQKLKFSVMYGNAKESDVIAKEIEGLKKLQELSIEARNENETLEYKKQIKLKEFLLEQMKILESSIEEIEKKNNNLKFNFKNASPEEKNKILELENILKDYSNNFKNNINEKLSYGMLSESEALEKLNEIFNAELEIIEKLKQYDKYTETKINQIKNNIEVSNRKYEEETFGNNVKADVLDLNYSERLSNAINAIEQQKNIYIENLLNFHKLLKDKTLTNEKRVEIEKEIQALTEKIKGFVKDIDVDKTTQILADSLNSIDFGKTLNENLSKAIEESVKKANSNNLLNESIITDMTKTFNKMLEKEKEKLGKILTEEDIEKIRDNLIDKQIKIYEEKNKMEEVEILKKQRYIKKIEEITTSINNVGDIFNKLSKITKNETFSTVGEMFTSLSETIKTFNNAGGMEGLKGVVSAFQNGGLLAGIGAVNPYIQIALTAVSFISSIVGFFTKKMEEEEEKSKQKYDERINKNREISKSLDEFSNSLKETQLKLIKNISENTSDKNLKKQTNYYKNLMKITAENYEGNIVARGKNIEAKNFLGILFPYLKIKTETLETNLDGMFKNLWGKYEKNSKGLQKFYNENLKKFDSNKFNEVMGTKYLVEHNLEDVKKDFLKFIDNIRVMEEYLSNLPKSGILESFEGVNVSDVFEQRKEIEEHLKKIYKSNGKDPEQFRTEIIQKVNELVQGDKVLITAFEEARNRTIEQLSEGNEAINGLAQGLESYFTAIKTNLSKVMYDGYFQNLEEQYTSRFENIANSLADFRLKGGKDIKKFAEKNLSFEDLFLQLKSVENINSDMEEIILSLREQARRAGLGEDIINSMFPNNKISEKVSKIQSSLREAMEVALNTSSFNQFSMSLGESIYQNVKESLVDAFTESSKFQKLMDKFFIDDEYNKMLEEAQTFEEAYKIIKNKQDEIENKLKTQGLGFRETDATTGEYLGGMTTQIDMAKSRLAQEAKSFNFTFNLENKGFLALNDFMDTLKKEMKEFMYKSVREEA